MGTPVMTMHKSKTIRLTMNSISLRSGGSGISQHNSRLPRRVRRNTPTADNHAISVKLLPGNNQSNWACT